MKVTQLHLMGIVIEAYPSRFPYSVGFAPNEELMKVLIGPAEGYLKRVVELGNRAVALHEQTTPDLGTHLAYPDAELIDLNCLLCVFHPSSYSSARSIFSHTIRLFTRFAQRSRTLCSRVFLRNMSLVWQGKRQLLS